MSKEKQIEEMAIEIAKSHCKPSGCGSCYLEYGTLENSCEEYLVYKKMAESLYNAGYRKQSEGEWEIKSEIYKMIDDVDEEIFVECPFCHRRFYVPYELDDEKILKYARENYPYCNCGAKMKGGAE